jgi:hypothetical protein
MTRKQYDTKAKAWRDKHEGVDHVDMPPKYRLEATKLLDAGAMFGLTSIEVAHQLGIKGDLIFIWRAAREDIWAELG